MFKYVVIFFLIIPHFAFADKNTDSLYAGSSLLMNQVGDEEKISAQIQIGHTLPHQFSIEGTLSNYVGNDNNGFDLSVIKHYVFDNKIKFNLGVGGLYLNREVNPGVRVGMDYKLNEDFFVSTGYKFNGKLTWSDDAMSSFFIGVNYKIN